MVGLAPLDRTPGDVRWALLYRHIQSNHVRVQQTSGLRLRRFGDYLSPSPTLMLAKATPFLWLNIYRSVIALSEGTVTPKLALSLYAALADSLGCVEDCEDELREQSRIVGVTLILPRSGIQFGAAHIPELDERFVFRIRDGGAVVLTAPSDSILEANYSRPLEQRGWMGSAFAEQISIALELIKKRAPEVYALRVRPLARYFIPIVGVDEETHCSFTSACLPGVQFLSMTDSPFTLAEAIVHESGHTELNAHIGAGRLGLGAAARYYSPWREDPRPLDGLIHGIYVFALVLELLLKFKEEDFRMDANDIYARRFLTLRRLQIALAQIVDQELSATGQHVVGRVRAYLSELCITASTAVRARVEQSVDAHYGRWVGQNPHLTAIMDCKL